MSYKKIALKHKVVRFDVSMKHFNKSRLGKIFLIIWIPLISIVIGFQMVNHIVSMPLPEDYKKINENMPLLRQSRGWLVVHVIYQNCSCTNALNKSLINRGAKSDVEEWVIYAGSHAEVQQKFEASGFYFCAETKTSIGERYDIEAAPMLLISLRKTCSNTAVGILKDPLSFVPWISAFCPN